MKSGKVFYNTLKVNDKLVHNIYVTFSVSNPIKTRTIATKSFNYGGAINRGNTSKLGLLF